MTIADRIVNELSTSNEPLQQHVIATRIGANAASVRRTVQQLAAAGRIAVVDYAGKDGFGYSGFPRFAVHTPGSTIDDNRA